MQAITAGMIHYLQLIPGGISDKEARPFLICLPLSKEAFGTVLKRRRRRLNTRPPAYGTNVQPLSHCCRIYFILPYIYMSVYFKTKRIFLLPITFDKCLCGGCKILPVLLNCQIIFFQSSCIIYYNIISGIIL